jgi:3-mercaptopyruvate sulfurtransferase SseA
MARSEREWQDRVRGILKAELARRHISYKELADRLGALGVRDHERNIANKLSRGSFTAVFFIQCMDAIGCRTIHLGDDG